MKTKKVLFKNQFNKDSKGKSKPDFDVNNEEHMNELQRLKGAFLKEHPKAWFEDVETKTSRSHRVKVMRSFVW